MKVHIVINDERYADAVIDDTLIDTFAGNDPYLRANFISRELAPFIFAIEQLAGGDTCGEVV